MLASPDAVKDVFRGDSHALHSGEGNEFLTASVGRNSVLVLDDEPHTRQRRVLLPPLKGERMRSFFDAMQAATLEALRAWPVGRPVRMVEPMQRITLRVILQAVLGLPPGPQLEDIGGKGGRLPAFGRNRCGLALVPLVPGRLVRNSRWVPYFRQMRVMDEALFGLLADRRRLPAAARGENVLADLLAAAHEGGEPLSNQEIRDAVVTLLLAGHDTTAMALAWALEQIAPRADVVKNIT